MTNNLNWKFIISCMAVVFLLLSPSNQGEAASDDLITIIFTHDLHDNYYPFSKLEDDPYAKVGGFARIAEVIREEKARNPNAIVVDAGDYAMGTLFQTIFATESPSLRLFGQMDYDVVTFGNHEFDFRAKGLATSLESALESGDEIPPIVASNIIFPEDDNGQMISEVEPLYEAMNDYGVEDYLILERDGMKIGVFGLLGEEAAGDAPMSGVTFADIVDSGK